ncbi:hypothetical protein GOODEAATRI_015141 [Goodea atripinnis]|uniref:Uncharacterized protein n=1 Tax=Goodea atripinnis TaxID=208336 RepID=A0ABV0N1W2_9TELE
MVQSLFRLTNIFLQNSISHVSDRKLQLNCCGCEFGSDGYNLDMLGCSNKRICSNIKFGFEMALTATVWQKPIQSKWVITYLVGGRFSATFIQINVSHDLF